jgi:hypothetical protein
MEAARESGPFFMRQLALDKSWKCLIYLDFGHVIS